MDAKPAPHFCLMRSDTTQCSCLPMTLMKTCSAHALTQPQHYFCHMCHGLCDACLPESLRASECQHDVQRRHDMHSSLSACNGVLLGSCSKHVSCKRPASNEHMQQRQARAAVMHAKAEVLSHGKAKQAETHGRAVPFQHGQHRRLAETASGCPAFET